MERAMSVPVGSESKAGKIMRDALLFCGVLASLLYVLMNVLGALQFESYSSVSQSVSELSAIGAPSRPLWVRLGLAYDLLMLAFAAGIWLSAGPNRALRAVGGLLLSYAAIGFVWPPMHLRGSAPTLTDTLHIVCAAVAVLLMLTVLVFGAFALDKRFRIYTFSTILVLLVFGTLAGMDGPRLAANLPTPWLGVTERINILSFLLWIVALAIQLLRSGKKRNARFH